MIARIPICLIVGFLGSGKTTLLKHIIRTHADKQLAFIVNEFSALDVDGVVIHRDHDKVVCLAGGSVFCKCLSGQFIQTLKGLPQALHIPNCDGVIVEASGIADPGVAAQMLLDSGLDSLYALSAIIAVVDPGNIARLLEELPNIRSQMLAADVILLNKADVYDETTMKQAETLVRSINGRAHLHRATHCAVALTLFQGETKAEVTGTYAACADPNFFSVTANPNAPLHLERLTTAIQSYQDALYRAKGFLLDQSGPVYLDWTPSTSTRFDLPDYQGNFGFVLIGAGNKAPAIKALAARIESGAFSS